MPKFPKLRNKLKLKNKLLSFGLSLLVLNSFSATLTQADTIVAPIATPWSDSHGLPLFRYSFADPAIEYTADPSIKYMAYATGWGGNFLTAKSKDGINFSPYSMAFEKSPTWANGQNTWAPDVRYDSKTKNHLMYFTESNKDGYSTTHPIKSIGVALSKKAGSGFESTNKPLLTDTSGHYGYIDPSLFIDTNGKKYLVYKKELGYGYGNQGETKICIRELTENGTNFANGSVETVLLSNVYVKNPINNGGLNLYNPLPGQADYGKTNTNDVALIEAPYLAKAPDGTYVLFFSANENNMTANSNYKSGEYFTGYAISNRLDLRFKNATALLTSNSSGYSSPGAFQLYEGSSGNYNRCLFMSWGSGSHTIYSKKYNHYSISIGGGSIWQMHTSSFKWTNGHIPHVGN